MEEEADFSGNYIEKFEKKNDDDLFPGLCEDWEKIDNKYYFHAEQSSLEVTILSHDILKFRYGNFGYFEDDFSYAVTDFEPELIASEIKARSSYFSIRTERLKCHVYKENLKIKIFDSEDNVLLEDEKGYHWQEEKTFGGNVVISTKKLGNADKFFGLGDKTGSLNLKGTRRELWGTDCYGYGNDTDPVYKNIPFYLGLNNNRGYGLFMDNTFRSFFDFGHERKNVTSFWAQGGEMRYYFINGPKLLDVCQRYTDLTGRPAMPPKWSLGYHQSKWSYYPESTVRNLAKEFRDRKIPCDVIHLDIDYMDGFRCFTWDNDRFPDPQKMVSELREQGFKTIVIIDPGIKVDKSYFVYKQGVENAYFCTRGDGPVLKGNVWPGECHFPDFTNPKARDWWATLFEGLIDDGIAGVWNDMNEPAEFERGTFPLDVRHDFDGHSSTHRKAHNVYGSLMAQATNNGMKMYLKNQRAFTITRSAYAGIQKYASVWTGDNVASWEHLKIANIQCQRLSTSGISFAGSDVGGFIGSPDGELYTRWMQMAVFHPFFRTHSSGDHGDKEPWVFDEMYTNIIRKFIEMRYEIMPYIYSAFWQYSSKGTPMLRSMNLIAQDDDEAVKREDEFMLGDYILIAPVSEAGSEQRMVYLPEGQWYDYWTNQLFIGKQEIEVVTPMDQIPLFIKAGAIIPRQPKMQYTDEFNYDQLTLDIYLGTGEDRSEIYEDAGDGYEYQKGEFALRSLTSKNSESAHLILQHVEGVYDSCYHTYRAVFHGFAKPTMVMIDGDNYTDKIEEAEEGFILEIPKKFKETIIS